MMHELAAVQIFGVALIAVAIARRPAMPEQTPDTNGPWRDKSERFPDDALLRRLGYVLVDRPTKGEPTWKLWFTAERTWGPVEPQSVILARLDGKKKSIAEKHYG